MELPSDKVVEADHNSVAEASQRVVEADHNLVAA
jgi:hypothetical protein